MKKAQLKIMETAISLFVLFIIIAVFLIIQFNYQQRIDSAKTDEQLLLEASKISMQAAALPELQCSRDNIAKDSCVDLLKAQAVSKMSKQKYYTLLGYSKITLQQIYPETGELTVYENSKKDHTKSVSSRTLVTVYNPETKLYNYGVMTINVYS